MIIFSDIFYYINKQSNYELFTNFMEILKNGKKIIISKLKTITKKKINHFTKKYQINHNLILFLLITSACIIIFQFIFNKIKSNKNLNQGIHLKNTEAKSYGEKEEKIYFELGKINLNILDKYYTKETKSNLKYNHIHISLCLNEEYHLLASVTIASILKNADLNSYIHFHIIALDNLNFKIMKKIYSLKSKINNNTEIIFYNGKKVEEDFQLGIKDSERGAIDYGRLLITELVDDIDKIISLDIGDILVEKDLDELYKLDPEYKGYLGVEDAYPRCFLESIFNHKEKYVNGGVLLLNVKKLKEINFYRYVVKMFNYVLTQTKFYNPYSDIMNDFLPWLSTGFMSLKYNFPDNITINKDNQDLEIWNNKCSYYYSKKDIVIEAQKNVVIRNLYNNKVYKMKETNEMKKEWQNYALLTGFYDEICKKYIC